MLACTFGAIPEVQPTRACGPPPRRLQHTSTLNFTPAITWPLCIVLTLCISPTFNDGTIVTSTLASRSPSDPTILPYNLSCQNQCEYLSGIMIINAHPMDHLKVTSSYIISRSLSLSILTAPCYDIFPSPEPEVLVTTPDSFSRLYGYLFKSLCLKI
jgi:hypothetical protein